MTSLASYDYGDDTIDLTDVNSFKLVLFNLSGDTNECIKIGNEILNHVLFMHPDLVTDFIQKKFGLYSELTYFY